MKKIIISVLLLTLSAYANAASIVCEGEGTTVTVDPKTAKSYEVVEDSCPYVYRWVFDSGGNDLEVTTIQTGTDARGEGLYKRGTDLEPIPMWCTINL